MKNNRACPKCGFKYITVKELIKMLQNIKNQNYPVWVASTKDGSAKPFSLLEERPYDKQCVYIYFTEVHGG